jgi:hypothetical protein
MGFNSWTLIKFWQKSTIKQKKVKHTITGHADPEGSRRVKAARFLDIGTVWW